MATATSRGLGATPRPGVFWQYRRLHRHAPVDSADTGSRISRMTDFGTLSADEAPAPAHRPCHGARSDGRPPSPTGAPSDAAQSRFGAAASIIDRLDTRPLHVRQPRRPWWRFW